MLSEGTMYGYEGFFDDSELQFPKNTMKPINHAA